MNFYILHDCMNMVGFERSSIYSFVYFTFFFGSTAFRIRPFGSHGAGNSIGFYSWLLSTNHGSMHTTENKYEWKNSNWNQERRKVLAAVMGEYWTQYKYIKSTSKKSIIQYQAGEMNVFNL